MDRRTWRDLTLGTLSSDGEFVFSVEDLPVGASEIQYYGRNVILLNNGRIVSGGSSTSDPFNLLRAYDVSTGKLKWERDEVVINFMSNICYVLR